MQTASSRFWTQVSMSISYDDNLYTTKPSNINEFSMVNKLVTDLVTDKQSLVSKFD